MSSSSHTQIIEHVVLFNVKPDVDSDKIDAMVNGLNNLANLDEVLYLSAVPIHRLKSATAFTHVLHSRYKSKEDLNAYVSHPDHVRVVKESSPIWEDLMAVDWISNQSLETLTPPPGSVARICLIKVKENLSDEARREIMEVIKEKSRGTVGENFSPERAKGFSAASIVYFRDLGEMESHEEELNKEKFGDYVDDITVFVVELVVPSSTL